MKPYIITIARQYGSGGKTVGKMLAERLGIPFYNREIITMASEDSGVNAMLFSDERLKSDFIARLHARYRGDMPVPNDSRNPTSGTRRCSPIRSRSSSGSPIRARACSSAAAQTTSSGTDRMSCACSSMQTRSSASSRR